MTKLKVDHLKTHRIIDRFYFSQEKGGFKNLWKRKCEDIFFKNNCSADHNFDSTHDQPLNGFIYDMIQTEQNRTEIKC